MDVRPKRLITRVLEYAAMFALAAVLLRYGISIIVDIWWILAIVAGVGGGGFILYRIWRNRPRW